MFQVWSFKEGGTGQRIGIGAFAEKDDAVAQAKKEAEQFKVNGYNGENDCYWGRTDEGSAYRFFVEAQ
jgi:hypothetical protein